MCRRSQPKYGGELRKVMPVEHNKFGVVLINLLPPDLCVNSGFQISFEHGILILCLVER